MSTGEHLLALAKEHIGEDYRFVVVPKTDPDWHGAWDCAEFASWLAYQATGKLYGCRKNYGDPTSRLDSDANTGYWLHDIRDGIVKAISVEEAARTPGAFVLRYPPGRGKGYGHIVVSDGLGDTVEAHSHKTGVIASTLSGRRWDTGIEIPGVTYKISPYAGPVSPPHRVYKMGDRGDAVARIQHALAVEGYNPGKIDGIYGKRTVEAVSAYQANAGLLADGEVGPRTANALGVEGIMLA